MRIKDDYKNELLLSSSIVKKGTKGEDVKKIQEWLYLTRFIDPSFNFDITIDGDFGPQTESLVLKYQHHEGLILTGQVDRTTFEKLTKSLREAFSPKIDTQQPLRSIIVILAKLHEMCTAREIPENKGPWVRSYCGGKDGKEFAWCAGYICTILDQSFSLKGLKLTDYIPNTLSCDKIGNWALEKGLLIRNEDFRKMSKEQQLEVAKPGNVFLVSKTKRDWVHTGLILYYDSSRGIIETCEGNSNSTGSREGTSVIQGLRNMFTKNIDIVCLNI